MKYFAVGAGLLALLLASSIWSSALISHDTMEIRSTIEDAVTALKTSSFSDAAKLGHRASEAWRDKEALYSALLSHTELDEIESAFAELEASITMENEEDFLEKSSVLLVQLRHIAQKDLPSLPNLLTIAP